MRRLLLILLTTISLTGCQFFNREDPVVIEPLTPAEGNTTTGEVPAAAGDFSEPTVEAQPTAVAAPDLIRSTDPDARARQINRNRVDPFASLPIPPAPDLVVIPPGSATGSGPTAVANGGGTNSGGINSGGSSGIGRGGASAAGAGRTSNSAAATARVARPTAVSLPPPVRVQHNNAPLVNPIAALPTIPRPVIAPTISVSGVIQMGNESYAIVRTDSGPERYVRVGDRLGGGSVRVKRIEALAFEPRVILEENGIEVSRPISSEDPAADPSSESADEPVAGSLPAATTGAQATIPTLSLPRIRIPSPAS